MQLLEQFSILYLTYDVNREKMFSGHPVFNKEFYQMGIGTFKNSLSEDVSSVSLPEDIKNSILKFIKYFDKTWNYSKDGENFCFKFIPFRKNDEIIFIFKGAYRGSLGRFNPLLKSDGETYYTGTGESVRDSYQKKILSIAGVLDLTDKVDLEKSMKLKSDKNQRLISFENTPKELISNVFYLEALREEFGDKSSFYSEKFENFGKEHFYKRIEFENIIIRPATWVLKTNVFKNIIASDVLRKSFSIPRNIDLNIFGGTIPLDFNDKQYCMKVVKIFIDGASKNIDHIILEENMGEFGYKPLLSSEEKPVMSELIFGITVK